MENLRTSSLLGPSSRVLPAVGLLGLAILMVPAFCLAGDDVSHSPVACMPLGDHPVIQADLAPGVSAKSVRVYFRAARSKDEYFVVMRRGEGTKYQAVLPAPLDEGETVRYSITVNGENDEIFSTPGYSARVSSTCPALLNESQRKASRNIVVGLTRRDQGNSFAGFSCKGIVAKISAAGELSSLYGCDGSLARFGTPAREAGFSFESPGASTGSPARVADASSAITAASSAISAYTVRSPVSGNGLVIGGTNTIGVTAGVLNSIPISSCRPR